MDYCIKIRFLHYVEIERKQFASTCMLEITDSDNVKLLMVKMNETSSISLRINV